MRRTTTSSQTTTGSTRTTCSSQCTTSTPMTTFTPTIAWCTSCVERAHGAHYIHGTFSLIRPLPSSFTFPSCPSPSTSSTTSCSLSSTTRSSWQVCATPQKEESEDTLNVSHSLTGYEPKLLTFGELNYSSVPFSFMIPSSDQDVGDVTLSKMLTAAHRGQVDYCVPEGMSVSQSSSVMFDGSGQLDGERNVDQSVNFGVTRQETRTVLRASFLKTSKLREWSIDQGNLMSVTARTHRLGLYLKSRDRRLSRNIAKKSVITNSKQLMQKKSVDSYKDNLWRQKLEFREVHQQRLTEMKELLKFQSSTFDTTARRKFIEDQNTILELSGRVQELQNEVNCMNDSKDFQDAESVRSGNSHVTRRPVSFPPHLIPEGMLRPSFITPSRREGPPSIWDTHCISGNVFADPLASSQHLILKN